MTAFWGEFIGTMILILLGNGVVANVLLAKTKGNNGGLISITLCWGIAVFSGVYASNELGGSGHLNPVVSVVQALLGNITWSDTLFYILAQFSGAITGSVLVWLAYRQHYESTTDPELIRATFCNTPALRHTVNNLITEAIGTFMLIFGALLISPSEIKLGALDALPVALLVVGIGLALGGPTGYAINPARDLGPRIAHYFLPIPNKKDSDWAYAWIPVAGPLLGGMIALITYQILLS